MASPSLRILLVSVILQLFVALRTTTNFKLKSRKSQPLSMNAHSDTNFMKRIVASSAMAFSLGIYSPIELTSIQYSNLITNADSTGKFSTKLTAKRRYLPRIVTGVTEFRQVLSNPTVESINVFLNEKLPGLQRAMNLYGASLRKGEVPDEISRTAEKLTEEFVETTKRILIEKNKKIEGVSSENLSVSKVALDAYLKFASLSPVDSADYTVGNTAAAASSGSSNSK